MSRLDLTGERFGKLVALHIDKPYIKPSGRKISTWHCQCDCGNTTTVRTEYLRSGHTTSCGCSCGRVDIIGKKYGRLTVIKYVGSGKHLCKCECGNEVEVITENLNNGNTKSCGCYQKDRSSEASIKSLIGQKFGKLMVVERVENNRFGHICYKCKCDCGGMTIVDSTNLRNGTTNSCGCIKSKGEMIINSWLYKHNIKYTTQYSVDEIILDSGRHPFYDFAIFNDDGSLNCLIEYNGTQHYFFTGYGWDNEENFKKTQHRDIQKSEWCKKLNIPLYIIKYDDDINQKLYEILLSDMKKIQKEINEEEDV